MTLATLRVTAEHTCFGGAQRFYRHDSAEIGLPMNFSVFLPPKAVLEPVPALLYLAGLACTEETFVTKAGAQRLAASLGLALIAPDTSPRGTLVPGDSDSWDFGIGASFYLDATEAPWSTHWRMESYLLRELLPMLEAALPIDGRRLGIFGHSMGGHGAFTLALRHPGRFASVSAFAPICAPTQCPWGEKAFGGYLGPNREDWLAHDATALMGAKREAPYPAGILVDQGLADKFLETQLNSDLFEAACFFVNQPLTMRRHHGYDHGYFFIQSFMADHLVFHAARLGRLKTGPTKLE